MRVDALCPQDNGVLGCLLLGAVARSAVGLLLAPLVLSGLGLLGLLLDVSVLHRASRSRGDCTRGLFGQQPLLDPLGHVLDDARGEVGVVGEVDLYGAPLAVGAVADCLPDALALGVGVGEGAERGNARGLALDVVLVRLGRAGAVRLVELEVERRDGLSVGGESCRARRDLGPPDLCPGPGVAHARDGVGECRTRRARPSSSGAGRARASPITVALLGGDGGDGSSRARVRATQRGVEFALNGGGAARDLRGFGALGAVFHGAGHARHCSARSGARRQCARCALSGVVRREALR